MAAYPPIRFHLFCRVRRSRRRLECLKARGVLITNAPTLCVTCRPVRCVVLLVVLLGNLTNALSALRAAAGTYTHRTLEATHTTLTHVCALLVCCANSRQRPNCTGASRTSSSSSLSSPVCGSPPSSSSYSPTASTRGGQCSGRLRPDGTCSSSSASSRSACCGARARTTCSMHTWTS